MKSWIPLLGALLVAGALLVRPQPRKTPRVVHADTGCDATILNGAYGYSASGSFFDNGGGVNFISAAGRLVFDGQGNISAKDTVSIDGSVTRAEAYAGTYTVGSDCTGSLIVNQHGVGISLTFDFALANNGNEIHLIDTDHTNLTGTAKKQIIAAPASGT